MDIEMFHFDAYCLDLAGARLLKNESTVALPPKALAALIYLVQQHGRLISKEELLDAVWGHRFVSQGVLKNTVTILRQALDDDPKTPRYIETVHRLGYRFIAEVRAAHASAMQTPAMATIAPDLDSPPLLVGRAGPLAKLGRLLEKSILGEPQLTFVTGEPGIGKTALIDAFSQSASHRVVTGHGQCVEQYGQGEPYLPVLEALNDLIRHDEARLSALLRQVAPTWLAQLPWYLNETDQTLMQQVMAGTTQMRMLREFGEFLGRCTAEQPLILVLEDLHWSDHATLDLLAYLARRKQPARWLILGSYRPEDVMLTGHDLKHVLRELQIQGLCTDLPLEPLSEAAIGEYLSQRFTDRDQTSNWARAIHSRTGGLPFFLVQLIETLQGEQGLDRDVAIQASALPEGVQQLLARQFERLSEDYRRVLEAACVAGSTFSAEAVAAALAIDNTDAEEYCENLANLRHFIHPATNSGLVGRYSFRHAFYQKFAYDRLPLLQCARLHLNVGEWLESARKRPEELAAELALHFERGRDWEKAVKYLQLAAGNAVGRHALHEAAQLLRRGLALLEDKLTGSPEYARYGTDLNTLYAMILQAIQGYGVDCLETIYARALSLVNQLGETQRLLRVLWGLWAFHYVRSNLELSLDYARQMQAEAEQAEDTAGLIGAHFALGTTYLNRGELDLALGHAQQCLALYDPDSHRTLFLLYTQDPGVCARYCLGLVVWLKGFPEQAMAVFDDALALAEDLGHPFSLAIALSAVTWQHVDRREPARVLERCEALERLAEEHSFLMWQAMATIMRGWAIAMLGQAEAGIVLIEQGLATWRATGSRWIEPRYLTLLAEAYAMGGRFDEGLKTLDEAFAKTELYGERRYEAEVYLLRGELLLQTGNESLEEAESCFQQALTVARGQGAKSLELRAAVGLTRLSRDLDLEDDASKLLGDVYAWFTEGWTTPDLLEAKTLLEVHGCSAEHFERHTTAA
ncbi:AAA family ATPase [Methylomonas sp. LL1]|uniref:AAA family ATPase n=1 Tax=Methylomonas sp. LL1 TaxID=2785785 RepID=UPI0018C3F5F4|nr:AAA family ATPase [Methylomonas sp. LL1]QPK64969.1 AAA family ATPase [Methylomonas sp. LL1]